MRSLLVILLFCLISYTKVESASTNSIYSLNEDWVCGVKKTCGECMRLSHCSWCRSEKVCFSGRLRDEDFCKNDTFTFEDFDLSIDDNAECLCSETTVQQKCAPDDADPGSPLCSGRGDCRCGKCYCNPLPDPEHPSKTILGEFCEFDNFSCDGEGCGEGPYPLSPPAPDDGGAGADDAHGDDDVADTSTSTEATGKDDADEATVTK